MEKPKQIPRSSYYVAFAILALIIYNTIIAPMIVEQPEEISYSQFMDLVNTGEVSKVDFSAESLLITVYDEQGKEKSYLTGAIYNPNLIEILENKKVEYKAPLPQANSFLFEILLSWLLPLIFLLVIGNYMTRTLFKRASGDAMSFGKSNAKVYIESQEGKTFADVAGQDEGKRSLMEVVDFLHNPERYTAMGANIPKGLLLVGPPGTGKTLLAQATAGEAGVAFFSISGSDFVEMFAGMGATRVRDLFKQAAQKAPCIVFIDEIDTIGKRRDIGGFMGGNDEREQTLNQLLNEMDGFESSKGVVLIGATNRPEILDPALLRPGRFDRRIPVELPDLAGRTAILNVHLRKINYDDNVDVSVIARATPGASGADLANIVNEAALLAVRNQHPKVSQSDIEEAMETVIAGEQRRSAVITPKERFIIAVHEMGHALVSTFSSDSIPVHKITIVPRTSGALGYTMQVSDDESVLLDKQEALTRIRCLLGGRAAEEIILGSITSGAANDIEQATHLARAMVTRLGMSEAFDMMHLEGASNRYLGGEAGMNCAPETAARADQEILNIIRQCHKEALDILKTNRDLLEFLAGELLEAETMSGDDFRKLLTDKLEEEAVADEVNDQASSLLTV